MPFVPKGEYLQYGGQAIIEGVMMRSPKFFSIACRAPNGTIVRTTEAIEKTWIGRQKWLQKPFLRGTFALLDSMALGIKAMRFAAQVQTDPVHGTAESNKEAEKLPTKAVQDVVIAGTMIVSLGIGILVFNVMPNALAEMLRAAKVTNGTLINYVSELIKVIIFFAYIYGISFMPEIKEVFRYHGAEHKAINAMERDQELSIDNCIQITRIHPRCGTSFAVIVLLVGFLLMPLVPRYPITGHQGNFFIDVPVRIVIELCLLPLIAGVSYELLRLAGKMRDEKWVNIAFKPGMWTQLITTKEPAEEHVEVAIAALNGVLVAEQSETGAVTGLEILPKSSYTKKGD